MPQVLPHYLDEVACRQRQRDLMGRVPAEIDTVILTAPIHITYLCDLQFSPIGSSSHALAVLVLEREGKATLFADNHLLKRQPEPYVDSLRPVRYYTGQDAYRPRRRAVLEAVLEWLEARPTGKLACDLDYAPAALAQALPTAPADVSETIRTMRRAKWPDEVALIERSARAIEAGLAWALEHVRPGMTERDVYGGILRVCTEVIGEPVVVYGDFASGPRTWEDRGGPPTNRVLEAGDLLILDFSVPVGGYRADFTNTLCVGGKPSPEQQALMDVCLEALRAAEGELKAGALGRDVAAAAHRVLTEADPAFALPHHTGHGLGLEHPEAPVLGRDSSDKLVSNDVVTIEPGVYAAGRGGIRIEHNYLVTPDGFRRLSHHHIGLTAP